MKWPLTRPAPASRFTPAQIAAIDAERALIALERDIDRCLAMRRAARPARQEAARVGAQTRKERKA